MAGILGILGMVAGLGTIVCWIIILIEMFKRDSVISGIIGIICGLWAFIWGWQKVNEHGKKQIMQVWTACIIVGIICNVLARTMA